MLNSTPVTPAFVKGVGISATTAQTDKTGATAANIVTLYTADTSSATARSAGMGALVQDVTFTIPSSTSTTSVATTVCVFRKVGATRYLIREIAIAAGTGSTTAIGATSGKLTLNEWLNPGDTLDFLTTVTVTVHGTANVAEY